MQSDINGKSGFLDMFNLFNDTDSQENGVQCYSFGLEDIKRSKILKFIIRKISSRK